MEVQFVKWKELRVFLCTDFSTRTVLHNLFAEALLEKHIL